MSNTYNQADILNQDSGYKYDYLGDVESCPDNTSTPRTKYSYNEDNLLSQVDEVTSAGVTSTTMTWDADQARLKLQRGSDTWEMIFDYTCGMPEVLLAKSCVSSSTGYTYYVREPDGELVSSFDAAETPNKRYYHFDALGSTVMVTDGSGSVLDSLVYGAWGDVLKSPANTLDHYYYVGQGGYYVHSSTQGAALAGIMEVGVRFYDQMVGRFTQRDPVRVAGISDYAYAADRPTNAVDPTRRDCGQCSGPKANCVGCIGEEYQQCKYDCPSIWKIISHFLCLDRCRQLATACTLHCDNADSEWVSAPKAKDCMEGIVKKVITK